MDKNISINEHTKILVPAIKYDFGADTRLLIPYTSGDKIGFVSSHGQIIVEPKYSMYYGECINESDYIRVSIPYTYGFPHSRDKVATYMRPLYGLINYKGEEILKTEYYHIIPSISNKEIFTVQNQKSQYAVLNVHGDIIIPFGKYNYIDGFDKGLSRAKVGEYWGIINESGELVLPAEYRYIWNFYGRNRLSTQVEKKDFYKLVSFYDLNPILPRIEPHHHKVSNYERDGYGTHYGEFAGSYAQDVMGYSDDVINDAFEGDPDLYWNID